MAFFGLTALGPQDTFATCSKAFCCIYIFEDADFERAWKKVAGDAKYTKMGVLPDIISALFKGPAPQNDHDRIYDAFNLAVQDDSNPLSFSDYINTMVKIREDVIIEERSSKNKPKSNCEFNSSTAFKDSLRRHHRMERKIQDKQICPLTCSQEFGWEKQSLQKPVAGRETSAVAKFAEELIRNGIYY